MASSLYLDLDLKRTILPNNIILLQMYLDDRLRMKIDETERLKSIKGENARNPSDQNDAEQERERKRVFHGISRANRLALIVSVSSINCS